MGWARRVLSFGQAVSLGTAAALLWGSQICAKPVEHAATQRPEVKSLTFVTMRKVLAESFDAPRLAAVRGSLDRQTRQVLDSVEIGEWVAEDHMAQVMEAIYQEGFGSNDEEFLLFARHLGSEGVSRFLRIFLSLASARFILRRVPVVWNHLRRGAGIVVADQDDLGVRIQYAGFPFFARPVYRLLSLGNCQALVSAATGEVPPGTVLSWSEDSLVLHFDLRVVA